jgi:hypothetical protein
MISASSEPMPPFGDVVLQCHHTAFDRLDVVQHRLGIERLDGVEVQMAHRNALCLQRTAGAQRFFGGDAGCDDQHIVAERQFTHLANFDGRIEQAWDRAAQDPAIDRTVNAVSRLADALHLCGIAGFEDCHVGNRTHHRDVFDRLVGHAAWCRDARQKAHQTYLATRIGD